MWCYQLRNERPPDTAVDAQHNIDAFTGCGSLPYYFMWLWAAWIPFWTAFYVTFVEGGFEDVMPKVKMDWSIFTVLFSDMKNIAISASVVIVLVLIYIQRDAVFQALGIDDRYILHWRNLFGWENQGKETVLQICVWKVVGNYTQDSGGESTGSLGWLKSCSRRGGTAKPTLELGTDSSLFVRIAYGHNEPLNGRVIRVPPSYGADLTVSFKEVFRVNYQDATNLADQPPLYIELQRQDVYSRQDLGRVRIDPERLRLLIQGADDSPGLAERQVLAMLGSRPSTGSVTSDTQPLLTGPKAEDKTFTEGLRFLFEPLAQGGAIWYAIAPVEDNDA